MIINVTISSDAHRLSTYHRPGLRLAGVKKTLVGVRLAYTEIGISASPPMNFTLIKIFAGVLLRLQHMLNIYRTYTEIAPNKV